MTGASGASRTPAPTPVNYLFYIEEKLKAVFLFSSSLYSVTPVNKTFFDAIASPSICHLVINFVVPSGGS